MSYLNTELDLPAIQAELQSRGRVQIRDFFSANVADALHRALQQVDWGLAFRNADGDDFLSGEALRKLNAVQRTALAEQIAQVASRGFQFSFFSHSIVQSAQAGQTDLLSRFAMWMAQEDFLSTMRSITGDAELNRIYAQGTLYVDGNFLAIHNDEVGNENRRFAYVINLTRSWRPDWGGLLHFCDEDCNVSETYYPHFNSMSLFAVPQDHFVSFVPPYAQGERLAVTGWLIAA